MDQTYYNEMRKMLEQYKKEYGTGSLAEVYQELQMASIYAEFQRDISLKRDTIALHTHRFFELILVKSGSIQYMLGSRRYHVSGGDVILIPPGISHCPLFTETFTEAYERYVLWLNADYYNSLLQREPSLQFCFQQKKANQNLLLHPSETDWNELLRVYQCGLQEKQEKAFCSGIAVQICAASILLLLNRISHETQKKANPRIKNKLLDGVLTYLDKNLSKNLRLDDVAASFYVSPSTISHLFTETLGMSFYQYLLQKRLITAKTRLLNGENANRAADACGFRDYSVFYRAFKKAFGLSPRDYVKFHDKTSLNSSK